MAHHASLWVSTYYPSSHDLAINHNTPDHWAIYIDDPNGQESLHQVVYPFAHTHNYDATVEARYGIHPRSLRRHQYKERILVGYISGEKIAKARNEIQGVEVWRNARSQTWVMDVLKVLGEKGYAVLKWKEMDYLRDRCRS
ncbi:MAG: hypothetical protein Q9166_007899 [cf. Caloplaca sp. 2 TL-2023]